MRVVVLGGTWFIGRRIVEEMVARGDDVVVVHGGRTEAPAGACSLHADRADFAAAAQDVRRFAPDAVVDTFALSARDAEAVLPHLPDVPSVVLSSCDVYRAYELLRAGRDGEPVPLTEASAVRAGRYPYRGTGDSARLGEDLDDYEKLDVEPAYLARGGAVLRLGFVYGEHDQQRREEPVLRRVRAGRTAIPVGAGTWLGSRCYVGDVAAAVLAVLDRPERAAGEVFNVAETASRTVRGWMQQILDAAGSVAQLVAVPDDVLPPDLVMSRSVAQHLLVDAAKLRTLLGWQPSRPEASMSASVRWHLDHPPPEPDEDFTADDEALAAADRGAGA
jgi:nucleoside-diphosphate-sugar epimerase